MRDLSGMISRNRVHADVMLSRFHGHGEIGMAPVGAHPCSVQPDIGPRLVLKEVSECLLRPRLLQQVSGFMQSGTEADIAGAAGRWNNGGLRLGTCGCRKKQSDECNSHDLSPDGPIRVLRKNRRCWLRRQLRLIVLEVLKLMVSNQGKDNCSADAGCGQGPETTTRDSQVKIDHIAVEHGSDLRIVMQLHAEGLVVDANDSAPELSSIL